MWIRSILIGIQDNFCHCSLISATEIITGTWRVGLLFSPESPLQCFNAKCGCLLGHAVIRKMRRGWQHVCIGRQQDCLENLVIFALCFRTGCNSNLQESSCKVTDMTSTSISLCQIFLLTAVSLLQTTGNGRKQHNGKCENAQQREFSKEQHGCCQMNEDVTRARRGFYIMTAECRGTLAHFLISESSSSQRRSFLCKQCGCFPADAWMASSFLSPIGLHPTGIQLSSEWGGDAIK